MGKPVTQKPREVIPKGMASKDMHKGGGKKPVDFLPGAGTVTDTYAQHGTGKEKK